jgi:hypothetical protein
VAVLDGGGDDARRGRVHERLDERPRMLGEHLREIAAFALDGRGIGVAHLADRRGQAFIRRDAALG